MGTCMQRERKRAHERLWFLVTRGRLGGGRRTFGRDLIDKDAEVARVNAMIGTVIPALCASSLHQGRFIIAPKEEAAASLLKGDSLTLQACNASIV